jgi:hypothetical protein
MKNIKSVLVYIFCGDGHTILWFYGCKKVLNGHKIGRISRKSQQKAT